MKWWRWKHDRYAGDNDDEWAAQELARSDRLLAQARSEVIGPLRDLRRQNNVSALIHALLHER